jgi:hypothetical protein
MRCICSIAKPARVATRSRVAFLRKQQMKHSRVLARARTAQVEFVLHLRRVNERPHSMIDALPIAKCQAPDRRVRGGGIGHAIGVVLRMVGAPAAT